MNTRYVPKSRFSDFFYFYSKSCPFPKLLLLGLELWKFTMQPIWPRSFQLCVQFFYISIPSWSSIHLKIYQMFWTALYVQCTSIKSLYIDKSRDTLVSLTPLHLNLPFYVQICTDMWNEWYMWICVKLEILFT